jgi:hypothetical protein
MTAADFRRIALSFDGAEEGSHMGAVDFRVGGRIFATLASVKEGFGNLMLTPEIFGHGAMVCAFDECHSRRDPARPSAPRTLGRCSVVGIPAGGGRSQHAAVLRSRKWSGAIHRREFGPRDPRRTN